MAQRAHSVFNRRMHSADETYLLIELNGRPLALPMAAAAEVLPVTSLERRAPWPRILAGFMNLRGGVLPVIDLTAVLDAEAPARAPDLYAHVVRMDRAEGLGLGLLVDRVTDAQVRADEFVPAGSDASPNDAAAGHLRIGQSLTPLLDPGRLLLLEEEARLAEIAVTLSRRREALAEPQP